MNLLNGVYFKLKDQYHSFRVSNQFEYTPTCSYECRIFFQPTDLWYFVMRLNHYIIYFEIWLSIIALFLVTCICKREVVASPFSTTYSIIIMAAVKRPRLLSEKGRAFMNLSMHEVRQM